ncbi:GntR family transcriptional regulator [Brachybacterium vulturis]|uniref:GntR family transcriptional regulator n=1 Tax=Brachybacterium vulturis TaxID=2017484 RepID=UPI003734E789
MNATELGIESSTINQRVYSRLCELLAHGQWGPNERLDERLLAEQLGVSRTPLREAFTRLASDGVVRHRPYQGNFVRTFTPQQVDDLYEVRKSLEVLAVRSACERATDTEVVQLRLTVDSCHEALDDGDLEAFEEADRKFHSLIVEYARNESLSASLRILNLHVQLVRQVANQEPTLREHTRAHRDGVVEAITRRDSQRAADFLAEHIADVQTSVLQQMEEHEELRAKVSGNA